MRDHLNLYDYEVSRNISAESPPFYALIAAAMRQADSINIEKLRAAFPGVYADLVARYNAPGGKIEGDA